MRIAARLIVVAALASAAILPATSANAVQCAQPFTEACKVLCRIGQTLPGVDCLA